MRNNSQVYPKLDPMSIEISGNAPVNFMCVFLRIRDQALWILQTHACISGKFLSSVSVHQPLKNKGKRRNVKSWVSWHSMKIESDLVFFLVAAGMSEILEELNCSTLCLLFLTTTVAVTRRTT